MRIPRNKYLHRILDSLSEEHITFLIGARRVGKTTLIKAAQSTLESEKVLYYAFDDIADIPHFHSTEDFTSYLTAKTGHDIFKKTYLLLDEVQNIPKIEIFLKDLLDKSDNHFQILASGSGSFEIFHHIQESLMGRKKILYVYPLSFSEFLHYKGESLPKWKQNWSSHWYTSKKSHIEEFLLFGGYPGVVLASSPEEKFSVLKEIVDSWVQTDIRILLKSNELLGFQDFLQRVSYGVGNLIKIDRIFQELHISKNIIKKYIMILEKSFLTVTLPPYCKNRIDEIKSHKKMYFWDTGLLNMIRKEFTLLPHNKGMIIEHFVLTELLKNAKSHEEFFFWRTRNGTEIDVIKRDILHNTLTGYEVKSGNKTTIPKSFASFNKSYHPQRLFLLNRDVLKMGDQTIALAPWSLAGEL